MKKNVASQYIGVEMIDPTDGSPLTTGTVTAYYTGDNGTQTAGSVSSGACTHKGNGYWSYTPTQGETNFDHIAWTFVHSSGINVTIQLYTTFPQTGDNYARLGAPTGASVSADIVAVKSDTAAILVDTGTTLDAKIDAIDAAIGTPSDLGGGATLADNLADIEAQTDDIGTAGAGLTDVGLSTATMQALIEQMFTYDATATYGTEAGSLVDQIADNAGGSALTEAGIADAVWDEILSGHAISGSTGEALSAAGSGADAATIADAVLDEALSGHTIAGSLGKAIADTEADVAAVLVDTGTTLDGKIDALNDLSSGDIETAVGTALATYDPPTRSELTTDVNSILSKLLAYIQLIVRKDSAIATDNSTELTAINANGGSGGGNYDNTDDSQEAIRDQGDSAWITATGFSTLDAAGVRTAIGIASANLDTQLGDIDTQVGDIQTVTDNLPDSGALTSLISDVSAILVDTGTTLDAKLDAIDDYVDTEVAAILTDTGTTLPGLINAVAGDVWTSAIEGSATAQEFLISIGAATAGKLSGADTTTVTIRSLTDAFNAIVATVDADGNRSAVSLNYS